MSGHNNSLEYRVNMFVRDHFTETIPLEMPLGVNDEIERNILQSIVDNMSIGETQNSIWYHIYTKVRNEHDR